MECLPQVYTIAEWCSAYRVSRAKFYQLDQVGEAPKSFLVGRRRLISVEAARAWREKLEAASE